MYQGHIIRFLCNSFKQKIAIATCRNYHITSQILGRRFYNDKLIVPKASIQTSRIASSRSHVTGKEQKFKIQDNIPEDWELIYRFPSTTIPSILNVVNGISLIAAIGITLNQFFIENPNVTPVHVDSILLSGFSQFTDIEITVFLTSLVLLNLLIRKVLNELTLRIYVSDNKYKAIVLGLIPGQYKTMDFTAGDIKQHSSFSFIPWSNNRYKANANVLILLEDYFKTASHMFAMFQKNDEE